MKLLFLSILVVLSLATILWTITLPENVQSGTVLTWVSDDNPARTQQIDTFNKWVKKRGHEDVSVALDFNNGGQEKIIIQGVSGVAGDLLQFVSGLQLRYFVDVGILEPQTKMAQENSFTLAATYPAIKDEISVNGEQYAYPCNVLVNMLIVNKDTFSKLGLNLPSQQMTFEEFEAHGKRFVEKANHGRAEHERAFYTNFLEVETLRRSLGLSIYNETLTACILDDARYAQVLELLHKWRTVDRILPTAADKASMSAQSGFGGVDTQMFLSGRYAMLSGGRYHIIGFRKMDVKVPLTAVEIPHGGFPNTTLMARSTAVYINSPAKEKASQFLAYLASEEYNMTIVEDGDGLPPNPEFTKSEAFLRPPKYPNEWDFHGKFAEVALTNAVGFVFSPYVDATLVYNTDRLIMQMFEQGEITSDEAGVEAQRRINREMERTLSERPELQDDYDYWIDIQKQIDLLKSEGKPIPASWVRNHYTKRYYRAKGMLDETR